jgi:hypothetical protein
MTYAELVVLIQDYCESSETSFVENIPTFVKQTENRVYRTVMLPELRANATSVVAPNAKYVARPEDFLSVFSFAVIDATGKYTYMIDKDVNFMREAYPDPTTTGRPKYYGQFDGNTPTSAGNFLIGPSADVEYQVELHYYYDPESIVTASETWLSSNAPTVLLYGCLIEAYSYLKGDDDMMKTYMSRYQEAMGQLMGVDARSKRDDYRDGLVR